MDTVIRVAAIDDHELILEGFKGWISDRDGLAFAGAYRSVAECLTADTVPDVVMLDVHLGDGSRPADNVRALKEAGTAVLIVSGDEEPMTVIGAIEAGADGYLRKGDDLGNTHRRPARSRGRSPTGQPGPRLYPESRRPSRPTPY